MTTCSPVRGRESEGIDVVVDVVPYQAILENLPVQLAAGTGPDMAKVTDLGGLNEYYLDLTPYVDAVLLGSELRRHARLVSRWARSGHLRHALAADDHRRLRERHALRAGGHRDAGRGCDLGRMGRGLPRRGRGHRHALPDGDRPLRPPRRGSRDLLRRGAVRPDGTTAATRASAPSCSSSWPGTRTAPWRATSGPVRAARPTRTRRRSSSTVSSCSTTPAPGRSGAWTNRSATSSTGRSWAPPAVRRAHAPACRAARASSASSRPSIPRPSRP
jgi:hypothetical protein